MGFGGLGAGEIVMIFLVVLLLFGAKRLPEIGSSLGKGIREFKGSLREIESEMKTPPETPPQRTQSKLHASSSPPGTPADEPRRLSSNPPAAGEDTPPAVDQGLDDADPPPSRTD
jgi:sec-independent protein translocase protein TatA